MSHSGLRLCAPTEGGLKPVAKGRGRAARGGGQTPQQRQKSRAEPAEFVTVVPAVPYYKAVRFCGWMKSKNPARNERENCPKAEPRLLLARCRGLDMCLPAGSALIISNQIRTSASFSGLL
jgi:hypothetical protein